MSKKPQWKLIQLRKEAGLTQQQMADLLKMNLSTYQNKENGRSSFKDYEAFMIMRLFNKKFEDIFLPTNCIDNAIPGEEDKCAAIEG